MASSARRPADALQWVWSPAAPAPAPRVATLGLLLMAVLGAVFLAYESWRLLFQQDRMGAIDLLQRHNEVQRWFAGQPIYTEVLTANYPPASMVLLWPVVGWLGPAPTRWLWAAITVASLACLVWLLLRESGAQTRRERAFVALLVLASYACGAAIGNGQLITAVLPALLAAVLLARRPERSAQLASAGLLVVGLVKPTLGAPFFALVLFGGAVAPAVLAAALYLALTILAAQFQSTPLPTLIVQWVARSQQTAVTYGDSNVDAWLAAAGLPALAPVASVLLLALLAAWVYRHRRADVWLLLGVTALFTNIWAYHWWYDDLVVVLAAVALYRLREIPTARILLAALVLAHLAPGGLYLFPAPLNTLYTIAQTLIHAGVAVFLFHQASRRAQFVWLPEPGHHQEDEPKGRR